MQAASSSTLSPPSARTASCPSNTRSFSGILLDVCPRTPCFLFLAAPGSPGRKLCHIVVSSTASYPGESHAFRFPPQSSQPQSQKPRTGARLSFCCLPRRAPMPCHATHMHAPVLPAAAPTCLLIAPGGPEDGHIPQLAIRRGKQVGRFQMGELRQARRHNPQYEPSSCPPWPAQTHPTPPPALWMRDQQEPAPGRPGSAEELLC